MAPSVLASQSSSGSERGSLSSRSGCLPSQVDSSLPSEPHSSDEVSVASLGDLAPNRPPPTRHGPVWLATIPEDGSRSHEHETGDASLSGFVPIAGSSVDGTSDGGSVAAATPVAVDSVSQVPLSAEAVAANNARLQQPGAKSQPTQGAGRDANTSGIGDNQGSNSSSSSSGDGEVVAATGGANGGRSSVLDNDYSLVRVHVGKRRFSTTAAVIGKAQQYAGLSDLIGAQTSNARGDMVLLGGDEPAAPGLCVMMVMMMMMMVIRDDDGDEG